jgi:hypothetical protein
MDAGKGKLVATASRRWCGLFLAAVRDVRTTRGAVISPGWLTGHATAAGEPVVGGGIQWFTVPDRRLALSWESSYGDEPGALFAGG